MTVSTRTMHRFDWALALLRMPPEPIYDDRGDLLNRLPPITVEQLRSMTDRDFARVPYIGKKTIAEIREILATFTDEELAAEFSWGLEHPSKSAWREHAEMVAGVKGA